MEDELKRYLGSFGYPVIRQGSLAKDTSYPPTFFTFWNIEEAASYYDNQEAILSYDFDVNVYSTDPNTAYSLLDQARTLLKNNGWIIAQRGYDVASDEISHVGKGMRVIHLS